MKDVYKIKYFCVLLLISILYIFIGYSVFNFEEGRLSEEENRYLKSIPKINFEMLKDGSFSKEIESFLTDNVYNRNELIDIAKKVKHYYSINNILKDDTIIFINNDININDDLTKKEEIINNEDLDNAKDIVTSTSDTITITSGLKESEKEEFNLLDNIDAMEKGSYIYYNGEAYNVCHLSQNGRSFSINIINKLKDTFNTKKFTVMVSPTKSAMITDEKVIDAIGNQANEIDKYLKRFKYGINTIDLTNTLLEKKDEYIFYKSDHHWTQLGAYYAYREYMKKVKRPYTELDKLHYEVMDEKWSGVAYNVTKSERFKDLKDTIENFYSKKYCTMLTCYSNYTSTIDYSTIANNNSGYGSYCGVKAALKIINIPSNNKDDILLITGDSFCDALVPILVENYGRIIYVDSRRTNEDLYKLALKFDVNLDDVKEVLVCCNFDSLNNNYVASKMDLGFSLNSHTIFRNKEDYFNEFFKDLYNYLINFSDVNEALNNKNIRNEYDFQNNMKNIISDIDFIKSTELLHIIGKKLSYNNDDNIALMNRLYEDSFLGYCIKNNYYLRMFYYLKDDLKYSTNAIKSIIRLSHADDIGFNMIK